MEEYNVPMFYTVDEVSKMLRLSRSKTYEFVCSPDCPFLALRVGRRICIPGNNFLKWYNSLADYNDVEDAKSEK